MECKVYFSWETRSDVRHSFGAIDQAQVTVFVLEEEVTLGPFVAVC